MWSSHCAQLTCPLTRGFSGLSPAAAHNEPPLGGGDAAHTSSCSGIFGALIQGLSSLLRIFPPLECRKFQLTQLHDMLSLSQAASLKASIYLFNTQLLLQPELLYCFLLQRDKQLPQQGSDSSSRCTAAEGCKVCLPIS